MAKVIGYKKQFKKQYKATCQKCGAIIVFDEDEISDKYQYNEYCFSVGVCPSCKEKVSFDKRKCGYKAEKDKSCDNICDHYKNGECTYYGTDWRECPNS